MSLSNTDVQAEKQDSTHEAFKRLKVSIGSLISGLKLIKEQNKQLNDKIVELNNRIEERSTDELTLSHRVETLERELQNALVIYNDLRQDYDRNIDEIEKVENLKEECNSLKIDYDAIVAEYERFRLETNELQGLESEYHHQRELSNNLITENKKLNDLICEYDEIKKNFTFSRDEITRKNHELMRKGEEITEYKNKISELESKLLDNDRGNKKAVIIADNTNTIESKNEELFYDTIAEKSSSDDLLLENIDQLQEQIILLNNEITNKNNIIFELESTLKDNSIEVEINREKSHEFERLKKNNSILNEKINELIQQLALLSTELHSKKIIIDEQSDAITSKEFDIEAYKLEIAKYKNELNNISINIKQIEDLKLKIDNKDSENTELIAEISQLKAEKFAYSLKIDELSQRINEIENEGRMITAKNEEMSSQLELLKEKSSVNDILEKSLDEYREKFSNFSEQIEKYSKQIENLQNEIYVKTEEVKLLNNNIEFLQNENTKLTEKILYFEQIEDALPTKDKIISEINDQVQNLTASKLANEIIVREYSERISELENIINNYQKYTIAIDQSNNDKDKLLLNIDTLMIEIDNLNKKLQVTISESIIKEEQINGLKQRNAELSNEITFLHDEQKANKSKNDNDLSYKISLFDEENELIKNEIKQIKEKYQIEIQNLESKLFAAMREKNDINIQLDKLFEEVEETRLIDSSKDVLISELNSKINKYENHENQVYQQKYELIEKISNYIKIFEKIDQ